MALPTPISPIPRTARRWLAGTALLLVTAGCAQGTPAEAEPDLGVQLDRVDAAVASRDYAGARDGVEALVDAATEAEGDGTITAEQADRIVAAAEALLAELPDAGSRPTETTPEPTPAPEPTAEPTAEPEPSEESDEDDSDESEEKPEKPGKGKAHGHDKDEEDDD